MNFFLVLQKCEFLFKNFPWFIVVPEFFKLEDLFFSYILYDSEMKKHISQRSIYHSVATPWVTTKLEHSPVHITTRIFSWLKKWQPEFLIHWSFSTSWFAGLYIHSYTETQLIVDTSRGGKLHIHVKFTAFLRCQLELHNIWSLRAFFSFHVSRFYAFYENIDFIFGRYNSWKCLFKPVCFRKICLRNLSFLWL